MTRRTGAGIVVAIGIIWIAATLVLNLFGKTASADRLTNDLRPAFGTSALAQYRADAATVTQFSSQIQTRTIPLVAAVLHTTPAAVAGVLAKDFPSVGRVLTTTDNDGSTFADHRPYLDHAADYMTSIAGALTANRDNFTATDHIPTSWLPIKTVAWLFLLLGVVGAVVGWLLWATTTLSERVGAGIVAAIGLVVIVAPFVLGLPGKTSHLHKLTTNFAPVFQTTGPLSIGEGHGYLAAVRAADVALETKVIPALPKLVGMPLPQVAAALRQQSPVVAAGLLDRDPNNPKTSVVGGILNRWDSLAETVSNDIGQFKDTKAIPGIGLPPQVVPWLLAGPGLLLLVAAWLILAPQTRRPAPKGPVAVGVA